MTTGAPAQGFYTVRSIQEMLGLSRGVITGLVAAGFVTPRRGPRNEYRFSFRDVVLLRAAQIAPRKILAALRKLKANLPGELPLAGLRITAVGNDVTVRDGRSQWQAESGQLVMDFEVAPAAGSVSFLKHRPPSAVPKQAPAPDAASWFEQGEGLEASDIAAAEAAYRAALALEPGHPDASLNLGALLWEGKRLDEAVALYDQALRRHPNEALLHFNRALALEDQGRLMEALQSYNTSIGLAPDLADAHYNAARLHEQLGDARKAVRHLSAYRRLQRK